MKLTDLKTNPNAPLGSIIPYYMQNVEGKDGFEPWCYNGISLWGSYTSIQAQSPSDDPFQMSTDDSIPRGILRQSPDEVMNAAIQPFRDALRQDAKEASCRQSGWNMLMEYDTYSTREFLGRGKTPPPPKGGEAKAGEPQIPLPPYNYETIQWMETFNG
jgi:hypothetical protein